MTNGMFKTWEQIALFSGVAVIMIYSFIARAGDFESIKPVLVSFILMSSSLFAKPIWLLGNWKEIKTWERTTAHVYESFCTRHRRGIVHYHVSIEFSSKNGRTFRKTIRNVAFRFKEGQKRDIMFSEEYMDALIFVPQAFRQAVFYAVAGVLLVSAEVVFLIVLG